MDTFSPFAIPASPMPGSMPPPSFAPPSLPPPLTNDHSTSNSLASTPSSNTNNNNNINSTSNNTNNNNHPTTSSNSNNNNNNHHHGDYKPNLSVNLLSNQPSLSFSASMLALPTPLTQGPGTPLNLGSSSIDSHMQPTLQ
jgi:hypothetical protein